MIRLLSKRKVTRATNELLQQAADTDPRVSIAAFQALKSLADFDDLPDLIEDEELGRSIQENVMMIDVFLDREIKAGNLQTDFKSEFSSLMIHGHCHQKSLYGTTAMENILRSISNLNLEVLDSGCCGMAGSFGYEKEHYEMSMKIGEDRLFPAIREKEELGIPAVKSIRVVENVRRSRDGYEIVIEVVVLHT